MLPLVHPGQCGLRRLLAPACTATALALAVVDASAQTSAPSGPGDAPVALERAVVTGSHIPQIDGESPLPIQVITREEIQRSGVTTAAQLLERVPANINGINDAMSVGNGAWPGLATANLRGLGSGSTLVLLNGRRLANYAFEGSTVDLNSIPLNAVDRVEILKDGASAIYGSDALAGVINFILRKDYAGGELTAYGAATHEGGGNSAQLIASLGTGDLQKDRYNVFVSAALQKDQALKAIDREFSRTAYRPDLGINQLNPLTSPSNILDLSRRRFINPTYAQGCSPPASIPSPGEQACAFDFATSIDLVPEVERSSVLSRATWRLDVDTDLFGEVLLTRNTSRITVAPTPVGPITAFGPTLYPAGGPYYPAEFAAANGLTGDLLVTYRAVELGPRINDVDSDSQRYLIGMQGDALGWDYNVAALFSRNTQSDTNANGYLDLAKFVPAMASGLINPWGPSGPQGRAQLDASLFYGTLRRSEGTTSLLNAYGSREIARWPAGPLTLALGAEARRERLADNFDQVLVSGSSILSTTPLSTSGSRAAYALFGEMSVSVLPGLQTQLALRYDDYSDFGSTVNPKVALRWQPARTLLLRGSWGTGFRAPPLYDLFRPAATAFDFGVVDPIRCPVTGLPDDCDAIIEVIEGGNPDLRPEKSTQWNVGVVWEPMQRASVGVDYWHVEKDNVIGFLWWDNALRYYDRYADRFVRGPADPAVPGLPGPIVGYDARLMNLGSTRSSGVDVALSFTTPSMEWGTVRAALQGTYVTKWETQLDTVSFVSLLGTDVFDGAIPRWRSLLTLDWNYAQWGVTVAQNYTAGYTDASPEPGGTSRKVEAFAPWDLQLRYSGLAHWQLVTGVRNLFDTEPPVSNQTRTFQIGYDPQVASALGRLYYVRLSYSWK
jgi:iron complex outermembrane receptor protein